MFAGNIFEINANPDNLRGKEQRGCHFRSWPDHDVDAVSSRGHDSAVWDEVDDGEVPGSPFRVVADLDYL